MEKPLLSIVIPVYNAVNTLRACVDSILAQAHEMVELILVDDGSAEETAALCDALSVEHPGSVRVLHQNNAGSLKARLAGSALANGEYILFVDADDVLLAGAIDHILADVSGGADLYLYDYIMESVGGQTANTVKIIDCQQTTEFTGTEKQQVSHAFMKGMMNTVCATAIRRGFYENLTFRFPEQKLCYGEDRLQKLQMLVHATRIVYVPYAFYYYKWYPSTQGSDLRTGKFSASIYENFRLIWPVEREYYRELGFEEEDCIRYDGKKLTRICGLLEKAWCNKDLSGSEVEDYIRMLQKDTLFLSLTEPKVLSDVRSHVQRVGKMIRKGHSRRLRLYWFFCNFIRNLRYRK